MIIYLLVMMTASLSVTEARRAKCSWDRMTDFPEENKPLIFKKDTMDLMTPISVNGKYVLTSHSQEELILTCPGQNISLFKTESIKVKCGRKNLLRYKGKGYTMKQMKCTDDVKEKVIKPNPPLRCGNENEGISHNIGFQITNEIFHTVIEVCFDHLHETTLYTVHKLKGNSLDASDKGSRPRFKADKGVFTGDINSYYTEKNQEQFFIDLLGENITKGEHFFVKGHMCPDAAFILHNLAQATYYYINVIPQWQSINNGNWKKLESSIRELASNRGINLEIWTGTHGVLTLKRTDQTDTEIFLGYADQGTPQKIVPIPALLWKVVHYADNQKAAAFVSVNNPFITSKVEEVCKNVCSQIEWFDLPEDDDLEKGQIYCCEVNDLKNVIPNAPALGSVSLLAN